MNTQKKLMPNEGGKVNRIVKANNNYFREIWNSMNVNDNKFLSLAEVDKGVIDVCCYLSDLGCLIILMIRF